LLRWLERPDCIGKVGGSCPPLATKTGMDLVSFPLLFYICSCPTLPTSFTANRVTDIILEVVLTLNKD
jgi:hypothetical protein